MKFRIRYRKRFPKNATWETMISGEYSWHVWEVVNVKLFRDALKTTQELREAFPDYEFNTMPLPL